MSENENSKKKISFDKIAKIIVLSIIFILAVIIAVNILKPDGTSETNAKGPGATGGSKKAEKDFKTITVNACTAAPASIESIIKLNGDISSKSEASIYPDISGKLIRILKNEGDYVVKGETIAYVDPSKPGSAYISSPVTSTVTGNIISLPVTIGNTVSSNTAIATVGSLSDLKLTIYVSEKYSNDLKIGLPGYVSVLSIPDETFSVRISKLSPIVDKSKRTIEVSLDFVKPDKRLKAGMFAAVRLAIKQNSNTVVVPKSALSTYNAEDCVYVIQENKAVRKFVKTGLKNDTQIEITDGIQFGETVITAGSVTNGSAVRLADSENSDNSDTAQKQ